MSDNKRLNVFAIIIGAAAIGLIVILFVSIVPNRSLVIMRRQADISSLLKKTEFWLTNSLGMLKTDPPFPGDYNMGSDLTTQDREKYYLSDLVRKECGSNNRLTLRYSSSFRILFNIKRSAYEIKAYNKRLSTRLLRRALGIPEPKEQAGGFYGGCAGLYSKSDIKWAIFLHLVKNACRE